MRIVPTDNIIFTVDDYCPQNDRIAQLLLEYRIPAVFLIELVPQYNRTQTKEADDQIKRLHKLGFEIGGHTQTHPQDMKLLTIEELKEEVFDAKSYVEGMIGEELHWFAYPRGRYNETVKDQVVAAGFKYARTTKLNLHSVKIEDELAIQPNIHIYQRNEYEGKDWLEVAKWQFDFFGKTHVFCHAWEIEKYNQWERFEELLKYITE